ncbi:unnamed protein product [Sphenostylis stenocarpa]|uniref:Uncharacterized protein n=1 Tax=Sphenostylis stenocarpa TaxID=92480 RepID=A0AA86TCW7_9FABA|nr:unnamed protein product [Sphenostylis stenocarpa]
MAYGIAQCVMGRDVFSHPNHTQILRKSRHTITLANSDAKFLNKSLQLACAATKHHFQLTHNQNRRSANYHPNHWTHEFVQSLGNHLPVKTVQERTATLEENVRHMINRKDMEPRSLLELIDDIQRLGLHYKFEDDINNALHRIVSTQNLKDESQKKSLHETALLFRLLRQHGFDVSQDADVFDSFKDEEGKFKAEISNDVEGMLSLYEASYLSFEGESVWEGNAFSRTCLMNLIKEGIDKEVGEEVRHVLEGLPYHQSFQRLEARWYIDIYNKKEGHDRYLLELAKLDFNMVQLSCQKELQQLSRWWMDLGLTTKLNFARDRFVESFYWSVGMEPELIFANYREELTKVGKLITIVDDIYDVYGTLDELELFTNVVERWDVNAMNTLPDYMMLCFLALYNTVNGMAYDIFKERGIKCLPYLTKAWSDLCKSYLQEAKWYYNKVIPPLNEFLDNGWISSSGGVLLTHSFFLVTPDHDITEQSLHSLANYHDLLRSSMTILRLCNDWGTSSDEIERGEISSSILSYMHETGFSEEKARLHYKTLIEKEWRKLNKYQVMNSTFSKSFVKVCINHARTAHYTYQIGDGFGRQDAVSKNRIQCLLIDPIPVA